MYAIFCKLETMENKKMDKTKFIVSRVYMVRYLHDAENAENRKNLINT